jgi:hypothetical protein
MPVTSINLASRWPIEQSKPQRYFLLYLQMVAEPNEIVFDSLSRIGCLAAGTLELCTYIRRRANRFDRSEGPKTLTRPRTANRDLQGELAALQVGKPNAAEFAHHCEGGRAFVPRGAAQHEMCC